MSPKTKRRRRRRKAIASIVAFLKSAPVDADYPMITPLRLAYNAAWTRYVLETNFIMHSHLYDAALATFKAEL